jgi:Rrf2 family transcriptional regulator, iron-sulfur cluster assembly transcription factor
VLPRHHLTAVAAVTDVALLARGQPVSARTLAERQGRAPRHLEALLQRLVHHGILKGIRGPHGGYALARERRRITVGEIVRIVDQDIDVPPSAAQTPSRLLETVIAPALVRPAVAYLDALNGITVEQLCRAAGDCASVESDTAAAEFHI